MSPNPVLYIDRSRDYYAAQGFERAYAWAQNDTTPYTPLTKPLDVCTVGLVTTAATYPREPTDPRFIDSGDATRLPDRLYANDLSWDKKATHLDDVNSFLPIETLQELQAKGLIGAVASRFHCAATEYSQRTTLKKTHLRYSAVSSRTRPTLRCSSPCDPSATRP